MHQENEHAYHQEHETLVLRCFVYFALYAVIVLYMLLVIVCLFSVNLVIINFYSHCNLAAHCNSLTNAI